MKSRHGMDALLQAVRRLWGASCVALALLAAQQFALAHQLAHAADRIAPQQQLPAESLCDLCLECAPFGGAIGTAIATVPAIAAQPPRERGVFDRSLPADAPVFFLSRAPPSAPHA